MSEYEQRHQEMLGELDALHDQLEKEKGNFERGKANLRLTMNHIRN